MRKLLLAFAALAAIGIALPASTVSADAKKGHQARGQHQKVVKVHTNRGLHLGWRKRTSHPNYNRTSYVR